MKVKTYVLVKTKEGSSRQAAAIIRRQPGVEKVDRVEGLADVIFTIQAPDNKTLAELTVQAISSIEALTEDVQLLPARAGQSHHTRAQKLVHN